MKTQEEILAELADMHNSPVDYSDIPPLTEQDGKTAQLYYKDFLNKLPQELVKNMVQQRLSEIDIQEANTRVTDTVLFQEVPVAG